MKTMKKNDDIKRVKEEKVNDYKELGYEFCPKKEWKEKVRDVNVQKQKKKVKEKSKREK
ncbi:MAG: hypothetical protein ACOC1O_00645 [bacterium]